MTRRRRFDPLVYVFGRAAVTVAAWLPQWLGYSLAAGLGRLYFRCSRPRREVFEQQQDVPIASLERGQRNFRARDIRPMCGR